MNTSAFLSALRLHPSLPVVFRHRDRVMAPGYHLTEVKRVRYETVDCGAMPHVWTETHLEVWAPPLSKPLPGRTHMAAGKLLDIVDRVEHQVLLPTDAPARVLTSFGGEPAALYDIESISADAETLTVGLTGDRTHCKAAERRANGVTGGCCSSHDSWEDTDIDSCGTGESGGCATPEAAVPSACCA